MIVMIEERVVTLTGGVQMPLVGFGTWQATGDVAYEAIRCALDAGYRHIDTATFYGNEAEVGRAVRESGLPREEVFITTKLPPGNAGRERETIAASLSALGMEYVDLWLVHWPPAGRAAPKTWQEFLIAWDGGLARAVGVSNYSTAQVDELISATGVAPAINQIPWGPRRFDPTRLARSRERGVAVEGYSPFRNADLADPVLAEIAAAHGVTTSQVVVRWHVEHGVVVIPKSVRPERIRNNIDVFDFTLTPDEVARIDASSR
jgi:diketogulonate reductase-like aldo/keto reductase